MKLLLILVTLQISFCTSAQNLVGVWQEGTPEVSSGYHNVYQFNIDGTFKFKTDEYFGLKRIISINGKYKRIKNALALTILSTTEVVGGSLERSTTSGEASDSWEIVGGEVKTLALPKMVSVNVIVESKKSDSDDAELILLDKRKYYKIK
jgi:hypothetical protein